MFKKMMSVRTVVAIGIGAALMFVLMRFASIPLAIPNTYLSPAPAVVTVFAGIFGPLAGLLIAFIGHTITDLTGGGVWWSWIIADAVYGLLVGLLWKLYKIEQGGFGIKNCIIFNVVQILANVIAWVVIAPALDLLIYQEPMEKVTLQSFAAGSVNAAMVLVLGSLLAFGYSKTRMKAGALRAE